MEGQEKPVAGQEHEEQSRPARRRRQNSVASVASTTGASSYTSTAHERDDFDRLQSPTRSDVRRFGRANETVNVGHSRSQSLGGPSQGQSYPETRSVITRRREKAAVGFACLNCKKAHLACDGKSFTLTLLQCCSGSFLVRVAGLESL